MGEPDDVKGQCNAHLYIGDNFGDNHATMRCQLEPHHTGAHRELYEVNGPGTWVLVSWIKDERDLFPKEEGNDD